MNFHLLLDPFLIGFAGGFIACVPVGPTNVTVINEGAVHGLRPALMIGFGAAVMEMLYCGIAFAGFAGLLTARWMAVAMELVSFILLVYLGFKYLLARDLQEHVRSVERLEGRLHPHTAFAIGFVRVLGNPGVLLLWITLSATFMAHEWVEPTWTSQMACVVGVGVGSAAWFGALGYGISRRHGRFSTTTLLRLSHVSGGVLLIAAIFIGTRLLRLLVPPRV